jgi:hypothetical protein
MDTNKFVQDRLAEIAKLTQPELKAFIKQLCMEMAFSTDERYATYTLMLWVAIDEQIERICNGSYKGKV